jgi:glucose/arabinose dehydrogenase
MGAHSAPLGLAFGAQLPAPYGQGALVGVHGSWNRQTPRAPVRCTGSRHPVGRTQPFRRWARRAGARRTDFLGGDP